MPRHLLLVAMLSIGAVVQADLAVADPPIDKDAPAFSISIEARDAITQEAVPAIRIVPASNDGVRESRTWQSQYRKSYTESPALFSMKRGWQTIDLRIDADGYRPAVVSGLVRKRYEESRVVELVPENGPAGRVLQPDGEPAAGAVVAMCTRTNEVMVRDGRVSYLSHGNDLRTLIQSDSAGRFAIPAEIDEAVIVIAHSSGYVEVLPEALAKAPDVQLRGWSRVEGRLAVGGVPVADQKVSIQAGRGDLDVILHYSNEATSDADGKFVVERIPPVSLYVSAVFPSGEGATLQSLVMKPIRFEPGTTRLTLPREGIPIVGKLKVPANEALSFDDVEVRARLGRVTNDWKIARLRPAEYKPPQGTLIAPPAAIPVTVQPDGSFRIESLPEGSWVVGMTISRKGRGEDRALFRAICRVELSAKDATDTVLDVGQVEMTSVPR